MILLIDNYDSFVHNLARHIRLTGRETQVVRNDAITLDEIAALKAQAILISPGPCTPKEAGISNEVIRRFGPTIPLLGVCLGHQCIGEVYGGRTIRAPEPMHGMASAIKHDGSGIFEGLPSPLMGGRYHSLVTSLPENGPLRTTARTDDGIIMAVQHTSHPVYGVQFHPESILTESGLDLLQNFVNIAAAWHSVRKAA
ncbi:MAG: aminodeoxychorismate/anthranilate synthase component II [Alphaproteobacteria bacterium]|nr:aminodeoxychorismate/anthranilate synthase component II [Alphaproteobacteria bacterium]